MGDEMTILGIDQSYTSSGICILNLDGSVKDVQLIKTDSTIGDVFARANHIANRVNQLRSENKSVQVGLEGLAFSKVGDATRDLAGLQFTIVTYLRYSQQFSDISVPSPNEVKKFATGKGNADKAMMHAALPEEVKVLLDAKKYRKTTGLYDVTDAYWIAKYALEVYKKRTEAKSVGM